MGEPQGELATFADPQPATLTPAPPVKQARYEPKTGPLTSYRSWCTLYSAENQVYLPPARQRVIDCVPDERFTMKYICYNVLGNFHSYNIPDTTVVTPLSLAAYCIGLVNGLHLIYDRDARIPSSQYVNEVTTPDSLCNPIRAIEGAVIPSFMEPVLEALKPSPIPRRPAIVYVASLASALNPIDFGRLIPIYSLVAGHNILVNDPQVANPQAMLNEYFRTLVMQIGHGQNPVHLHNSNLYGSRFNHNAQIAMHPNWMSEMIATLFSPPTIRNQLRRPAIGPLPMGPYHLDNNDEWNPYAYTLSLFPAQAGNVTNFFRSISDYIQLQGIGATPLLEFSKRPAAALQLPNCFTSGLQLPTYHYTAQPLQHQAAAQPQNANVNVDDAAFAGLVNYAPNAAALPNPAVQTAAPRAGNNQRNGFYAVDGAAYNNANDPVHYAVHVPHESAYPSVFVYMPFEIHPSYFAMISVLGLHIETGSLRGFVAPFATHNDNPNVVNSWILAATLRASHTNVPGTGHPAVPRPLPDHIPHDAEMAGFVQRRWNANVFPVIPAANAHAPAAAADPPYGLVRENAHPDNRDAFTVFIQSTSDVNAHLAGRRIHMWSSYRYRAEPSGNDDTQVRVFYTQAALYGENVTVGRAANPALAMPSRP